VLGHAPTYFEALTSAAFDYFARQEVDLAVFEVGLGGRLDATNATEPVLSLITQIGLEHQRFLGDTLTSIAREKAGILRDGIPAIAWLEHPETRKVVKEQAQTIGAELVIGPDLATVSDGGAIGFSGQALRIKTSKDFYRIETPLIGSYQRQNLALAVLASEVLAKNGYPRFTAEAIVKGARNVRWPGRLEMVELPEGPTMLLDVAHNPDGAVALRSFLDEQVQPYNLLFGALEDKEVSAVLPLLAERASRVILTAPTSPRALPPEGLRSLVPSSAVAVEPHSEAALSRALEQEGQLLVVCGSVYLVGEIRLELRRRFGVPAAAVDLAAAPTQLGGS
jgi:dihydrofolate synthase/folylpolyglutamate synthase